MDYRVKEVIRHIEDGFDVEITLEQLAQSVNISPSRLRHLFKSEVGVTPMQLLKEVRLRKAKELAEESFMNVKQIMVIVGLRDESHFMRDFKKTFGLTPTQCRHLSNQAKLKKAQRA
ncbi:MAG: two-component system, response regulator YesN [Blastocatellia bacterium]|nr:two-component system, response regulator YesN [Blastocatellia bacterium]